MTATASPLPSPAIQCIHRENPDWDRGFRSKEPVSGSPRPELADRRANNASEARYACNAAVSPG